MRRALVRKPPLALARLIGLAALVIAAIPVGLYLYDAAHRLTYPYELDWLEGGTVELVARVTHGGGLYSPPSLGFVGFTYTPLFSYLSAAVAQLTHTGFLPLRIVSVASSLVSLGVLWAYVRDATGSWLAGAVAAGIFAACYRLTGDFYDIGRLDSMYLALSLLALWLGRRAGRPAAGVAIGVLAFLAFFTKQVGLIIVGPALLAALPWRPRMALPALITLVVLCAVSTLVLDAATHQWYRYYILSELAGQPSVSFEYAGFWRWSLYASLPELSWLIVLGAVAGLARWRPSWRGLGPVTYDLAGLAGLLITAWVSVIHSGGYLNVLMPAYAAIALLGGFAVAALGRWSWLAGVVALGLVAWQFGELVLNPKLAIPDQPGLVANTGPVIPTHRDRVAGRELIAALRRLPGPVLVLRHPWYGTLAGKGSFAQSDGIAEVLRSDGARGAPYLTRQLRGVLDRDHIGAVVLDQGEGVPPWLAPQLNREFRRVPGTLTTTPLAPPSDIATAPEILYLRRTT